MSSRRDTEFERLMLPHLNAAHNLARWLMRDPALAEDLVQDAVLRAVGYFASYRGGNPRAWLLRIVRRSAYDALEVRRTRMTASLDDTRPDAEGDVPAGPLTLADPAPDPEAALAEREREAALEPALARLPPELRECLVLRELEEMSYREVAEVTGVPVGTVMSRLFRARQMLLGQGSAAPPCRERPQ